MDRRFLKIVVTIFVTMVIAMFFIVYQHNPDSKIRSLGEQFFNSTIDGEIIEVGVKYHFTYFKVKNDTALYLFSPITESINGNNIFLGFVQRGDLVFKKAKADTLTLTKCKRIYKYRFDTYFFR